MRNKFHKRLLEDLKQFKLEDKEETLDLEFFKTVDETHERLIVDELVSNYKLNF